MTVIEKKYVVRAERAGTSIFIDAPDETTRDRLVIQVRGEVVVEIKYVGLWRNMSAMVNRCVGIIQQTEAEAQI